MSTENIISWENENVLVTGGAGFIGSHLTERLVMNGASVTVLDDLSTGGLENLTSVRDKVSIRIEDITERDAVTSALQNIDIVFHLGANAHVPTSVEDPTYDFEINALGSQILFDECRKNDISRIIFASSAAVYGPPVETPIAESHPVDPISPYGASKLAAEKLGFSYHETYDLDFTALRIFNTYGPRLSKYVISDFFNKLEDDDSELEILGTGREVRSFAYIDDMVSAFMKVGSHKITPGEVYNFGGKNPIEIRELAEMIITRYYDDRASVHMTREKKPGDINRLTPDVSKIADIGIESSISLKNGLDNFYEWFIETVESEELK
jgi:UDP-glucose 4-epimerase